MKGMLSKQGAKKGQKQAVAEKAPDTALLYSVDDIARLARVSRILVTRLCLAKLMPPWREIEGRRYWDRRDAIEAVTFLVRAQIFRTKNVKRKNAS